MRPPRLRPALTALLTALVLAALASGPAVAQSGPIIVAQGDVRTGALPALSQPTERRTFVGTEVAGEAYRGLVGVEGDTADDVALVLVEAGDDEARGADRATILACTTNEQVEPGHTTGDGPETDCADATELARDETGTWRADVGGLLARPGVRGIVLVPVAGALGSPFTVVFEQAETRLDITGLPPAADTPPFGASSPPRAASGQADAGTSRFPAQANPIVPTAPAPSTDPAPTPDSGSVPTEAVDAPAPPAADVAAPSTPTLDAPDLSEPADRGRLVLVLAAGAAVGLALILPSTALGALAGIGRRREETIVNAEQLQTLNHRFRMLVGGSIALAVVVVASLTATVDDGGDLAEELVAGDASLGDGSTGALGPVAGGAVGGTEGEDVAAVGPAGGEGQVAPDAGQPIADRATGQPVSGSSDPARPSATSSRAFRPDKPLTASDQGVSAKAVRIATIDVDPQFYARFGIPDPMTEEVTQAYAEEINETGGILGRRWEPVIVRVADPTNEQQTNQACGEAFGDQQAFMMVNPAAYSGLATCAAQRGRILSDSGYGSLATTTSGLLDEVGGRYWVAGPASERLIKAWVDLIVAEVGTDVKIGYTEQDDPQIIAASEQFQAELERRGFPEPSVGRTTQDPSTAAVQVNNTIARYRQDGVQLVAQFVNAIATGLGQNASASQGYDPEFGYTFSSIAGADNEDFEAFFNRGQHEGAFGVSIYRPVGAPEQSKCQEILARRAPNIGFSASAAGMCHVMFLNRDVMQDAGADLTAASWAQAFGAQGGHQGPAFGASSYGPTKRGGADQYRVVRFTNGSFTGNNDFRDI